MTRLLASLLVALAIFFSPMAMKMSGGGAMAHAAAAIKAAEPGCAGMDHSSSDEQKPDRQMDCAAACAAIPATPAALGDQAVAPKAALSILSSQVLAGLGPEGETPPPRIASEI